MTCYLPHSTTISNMSNNDNINESMLDLFKIEIDAQSKKLASALSTSGTDIDSYYQTLQGISRAIRGAIKLVKVNITLPVIDAIDALINKNSSSRKALEENVVDCLSEAIKLLQDISDSTAEQLNNPDDNLQSRIKACISRLEEAESTDITHNSNTETALENIEPGKDHSTIDVSKTQNDIDPQMFDLFTTELDNSLNTIDDNLLLLESSDNNADSLEAIMRAAHSIKGAARMIGFDTVVELSHVMEDVFVAAQNQQISIMREHIDQIFMCTDMLKSIIDISSTEAPSWSLSNIQSIKSLINSLTAIKNKAEPIAVKAPQKKTVAKPQKPASTETTTDSIIRVDARRINKLIHLAGELSVSSNWVREHSDSILSTKRTHNEILAQIEKLRILIHNRSQSEVEKTLINSLQNKAEILRDKLTNDLISIDSFDRRNMDLATKISHEVIASRMRPFKDNTQAYKRMVRDISHNVNKKVELVIDGENTEIDRDIMEKLDAPLNHILRNAIDHGIEDPQQRIKQGKPETGTINISAYHQAGRLHIQIQDDGCGVDLDKLRNKVLSKNLVNEQMARKLSKSELLEFLFLPSFSTRENITEYSGRGVGLDIVHTALQQVRGKLQADTEPGKGMTINMELPLTLSVIRCLIISLNHELYAFPLSKITSLIKIKPDDISIFDDKQYITVNDQAIGLVHCAQILDLQSQQLESDDIPVIIIGDHGVNYGIVVDKLIGEKSLALRMLNRKLGKIKDISAAAVTDEGEPVLIFDTDDLLQSIHDIISGKRLLKVNNETSLSIMTHKRVLIVDDSLTVREIEKKLLESRNYLVETAIDGVDGWNCLRSGDYDLVVTDVDMPRMNGIELIKMIKNDAALRNTPVLMVSYKDRAEDKQLGLEAGADYYLTKGSFHDDTLLEAVVDLIGEATS